MSFRTAAQSCAINMTWVWDGMRHLLGLVVLLLLQVADSQ